MNVCLRMCVAEIFRYRICCRSPHVHGSAERAARWTGTPRLPLESGPQASGFRMKYKAWTRPCPVIRKGSA